MKVYKYNPGVDDDFSSNTYLIINKKKALIVDPGYVTDELLSKLEDNELIGILLTHGHFDHLLSLEKLPSVPIYIYNLEKELLTNSSYNFSKEFKSNIDINSKDVIYVTENKLSLIDLDIEVISTPGHTKGSVCYKIENFLFSGDTLFYNTVGRTDLPTGNGREMLNTLKMLTKSLSNNVMIHPGHDKSASLEEVKKANRYLR